MRAISHALRRSHETGAPDDGIILRLTMQDPKPDYLGRLEWLADARNINFITAHTPAEMVQMLGGVSMDHIHDDTAS